MRDPKRIFDIVHSIERLWRLVPDWRFGQLLENVIGTGAIWFIEDDVLEQQLDDFFKRFVSGIETQEKSDDN